MKRALAIAVVAWAVVGLGSRGTAPAGDAKSPYAPVPPGLAALVGTPGEESMARSHVEAAASADPAEGLPARAMLMMCGDAGLRVAAERLAAGPVSDAGLANLLLVVSASERPEVDDLLVAAAREPRFEARALAANGLGAGRTPRAVETLASLARDPMPVVRAAAVRALFGIEGGAARAARVSLADDADPRVWALRMRLHRLRGDGGKDLLGPALRAYVEGTSPAVRLEGARCLSLSGVDAPDWALALVALEDGAGAGYDDLVRRAIRAPREGYDPGEERAAAAEAVVALLGRPRLAPEARASLVDMGVEWVAKPLSVHGSRVDEEARRALVTALPGAGQALVGPVVRRLLADRKARAFDDPSSLVSLLVGLDEALSLPAIRSLTEAGAKASDSVLGAATRGLAEIGRVGDEATARSLLARTRPRDVRMDVVLALAADPGPYAVPLLIEAWDDPDDAVSSKAGEKLFDRAEPEARAALEASVLDGHWRRHEERMLRSLAWRADDASYAMLEKALSSRSDDVRAAAFDAFWDPRSTLRGPRAAALVAKAAEDPPPHGDLGVPVRALVSVDAPRAIELIRARLATSRSPGILLRNLQAADDPKALDLALSVAASTNDPDMLTEVARVLSGPSARDIARTDPFWRRCLGSGNSRLVGAALDSLARREVRHGRMADVLVPVIAGRSPARESSRPGSPYGGPPGGSPPAPPPAPAPSVLEPDPTWRRMALQALLADDDAIRGAESLLWDIASDALQDEYLRRLAAYSLEGRASPAIRAKALAWLRDTRDDASTAILWIARIVGANASPTEAQELAALFEAYVAARHAVPPSFQRVERDGAETVLDHRLEALEVAIARSADGAALDRMADLLFDPRFAAWSRAAQDFEERTYPQRGGPLSPLADPPPLTTLLFKGTETQFHQPVAPVPLEARYVIATLKSGTDERAAKTLARVVADARATGRLALFDDLYLLWLANDLHYVSAGDFAQSAAVLEGALDSTEPAGGPEELDSHESRIRLLERRGRFAEAAASYAKAVRIAARAGHHDRSPGGWLFARARQDFLEGAAAAADGRADEARAAFHRGLARAPSDANALNCAAWYRARAGFDLDVAEALARRALAVERRVEGVEDDTSDNAHDTLAYVLLREGKAPEALEEIGRVMDRVENSSRRDLAYDFDWRYAQALVQNGSLKSAVKPLLDALKFDPSLAPDLLVDPLLAPLREKAGVLEGILKEAERRRALGDAGDAD